MILQSLPANVHDLSRRIVEAVHDVEPGAEVILYGSRARGDCRPDSDWDVLILVDGPVDSRRDDAICHRLYELELSVGEIICPVVSSRQDWDSPRYRATPFHQNVAREGVALPISNAAAAVGAAPRQAARAEGRAGASLPLGELRSRIKSAVRSVAPEAQIILYGSHARGEAPSESAWDLLILTDGTVDDQTEAEICRRLYEIEWSTGEVLCPILFSRQDWASPRHRATPFHQQVERDGVAL